VHATIRQQRLLCRFTRRSQSWTLADRARAPRSRASAALIVAIHSSWRPCFETADGAVSVIDFMARRAGAVRSAENRQRQSRHGVDAHPTRGPLLSMASVVPWVSRQEDGRLQLTAGPDRLLLDTSVATAWAKTCEPSGSSRCRRARRIGFALSWAPSFRAAPERLRMADALAQIESFWSQWTAAFKPMEEWSHAVLRFVVDAEGACALGNWRHHRCGAPLRCRRSCTDHATGTIDSAGCATPRLRCMRSSARDSFPRRKPGVNGCCAR